MAIFAIALVLACVPLAAGSGLAAGTKGPPTAALIMIEEAGCPYCERWHEEIGSGYHKSDEGRFAPLTTYFDNEPEAARFKSIAYSPTFIVVQGSKEIGRIIGYPGAHFFWPMLDEILAKIGYAPGKLAVRQKAQ